MKRRKGFSLVELLVAIVVLGILTTVMIVSGSNAQNKARRTKAIAKFDGYTTVFAETMLTSPGIMKDREEAWAAAVKDAKEYSTKDGMDRLVREMNRLLDDTDQFVWGETTDLNCKCYVSVGQDPWGGRYVLTEYPQTSDTDTERYDLSSPEGNKYRASMLCTIWCSGPDEGILEGKIGKDSIGVSLEYINGSCNFLYHNCGVANANGLEEPFANCIITVK